MSTSQKGADPAAPRVARWTPWRVVVMLGVTSLAADMVYEGARSIYGPLLASLGATAVVVGVVTGAGEAIALVLRLVSGPLTDRTGRYWAVTIVGYGLTAVSVPLLAFTPFLGAAGLAVAAALILLERTGKAIRSPAKSALLADAATQVGTGRGFGVHKALDQTGAFLGPLLVAAVVGFTGMLWVGPAALAVPGVVAMIVLFATRAHTPEPAHAREATTASSPEDPATASSAAPATRASSLPGQGWIARALGAGLPRAFFWYAAAAGLMTGGLVTFGLIGYHLVVAGLASDAAVPVIYAFGMLAEALAALAIGWSYDRIGPRVLFAVPVLVAIVPAVAMSGTLTVAVAGVLVWGFAFGLQDSTIKALVADIVEAPRRATAYGVFAAVQGVMAIGGGLMAGWLYDVSVTWLAIVVACTQAVAAVVLAIAFRTMRGSRDDAPHGAIPA
ncbi:MFS transporter [Demequina salsinemoris]|uniref:MFS transporter n=1 Tax=Demequina salsinemoris TaxID=577470 RepID=UPI000A91A180|nr:MFS transporter [Demequina salsinemoris]